MAQLASPPQKASPKSGTSALNNSASRSSQDTSRLGYEILHRSRQSGRWYLPLSLPKADQAIASTGSELLDAFERDRIQQSIPLQNLRLIPVAGSRPPAASDSALYPPVTVLIKDDRKKPSVELQPKPRPEPPTQLRSETPTQPQSEPPTQPQPEPLTSLSTEIQQSLPSVPAPAVPIAATPEADLVQKKATVQKTAQPSAHTPLLPIRKLSAAAGRTAASKVTNTGKTARDSAAAVGLLDLSDTLLFGGDHGDLSCIDPFINQNGTGSVGVLTYLSQQVSAFTVDRLSHNLPISTNTAVLNKKDEPKRLTVLGLKFFKLSDLTEDVEPETTVPTSPAQEGHHEADEVAQLTQQLHLLHRKVDDLSRKLQESSNA